MVKMLGVTLVLVLCATGGPYLAQRQGGQNPDGGGFQGGVGARGAQGQQGRGRLPFRGRGDLPTGTASIRGRVIAADTGTPVRRAQIRATAPGTPQARLTSTDSEGRFELRDLPGGPWTLSASKPGFVTQRFGQRRAFETVSPLEIAEGQRFDAANFSLARGGAITGRVLDDFGDPLANARVQVLRSQMANGRRQLVQVGVADESDDTGAFRLYGLAPGDYYVSATLRANPFDSSGDGTAYAPTYFPGTGNMTEAQRITLGLSEEQTNVNFALLPVRTVRVSGSVTSSSGSPLGGGIANLTGAGDVDESTVRLALAGQIGPDGTFFIPNVAPGSYTLNVRSGPGRTGGEPEVASLPLVVGTENIVGLSVVTTRGASVQGTVVVEGSSARPTLGNLQVTARALRQVPGGAGRNARVSAEGSFLLSSLVGSYSLRVDGLSQQWTVKSIVVNGTDVTDAPLDFRGNEQVTGARVVLTDRITEVNGTVTERGQPIKDYSVVVFADDAQRWTFPTRYLRSARGNAQGGFNVRGLPPESRYLAVAVDYLEDGEFQDPEFLASMREKATSFTLREGETKTIDLRLIER